MRINQIFRTELVTKDLASILIDPDREVLGLVGPVGITHPKVIIIRTGNDQVLVDARFCFVCTGGGGVPLTLATLRPFSRHSWSIHAPAWSFRPRQIHPGRILHRFTGRLCCKATHVFRLIPKVLGVLFRLRVKSCGCDERSTDYTDSADYAQKNCAK